MSRLQGIWTCLASDTEPLKRSSQCLSVIGNTAYIFGGELEPRQPRDNAVFALTLDASGSTSPHKDNLNSLGATVNPPFPRVGAASTALGGKLYCFGGRGGVSMTCLESHGSFDVFNPATSAWSVVSPTHEDAIPEDRSYHSMTSDNLNTIYLHAGCPATGRLNDLWAFDVTTSKWTQLASAPGSGRGGTSLAFSSGKLYRLNGFDGQQEQGGSVDVYDIKDGKWSSLEYQADGVGGPEPRSVAALVPVKNSSGDEYMVTMFGEGSPSDLGHAGAGRMFADVWAFDVKAGKWHCVKFKDGEPAPTPRGWFDADAWIAEDEMGDQIVVHGGLHGSNSRLDDVWLLQIV
jgi:hypothetical protein